jgi:hypothetical protein
MNQICVPVLLQIIVKVRFVLTGVGHDVRYLCFVIGGTAATTAGAGGAVRAERPIKSIKDAKAFLIS